MLDANRRPLANDMSVDPFEKRLLSALLAFDQSYEEISDWQ